MQTILYPGRNLLRNDTQFTEYEMSTTVRKGLPTMPDRIGKPPKLPTNQHENTPTRQEQETLELVTKIYDIF